MKQGYIPIKKHNDIRVTRTNCQNLSADSGHPARHVSSLVFSFLTGWQLVVLKEHIGENPHITYGNIC